MLSLAAGTLSFTIIRCLASAGRNRANKRKGASKEAPFRFYLSSLGGASIMWAFLFLSIDIQIFQQTAKHSISSERVNGLAIMVESNLTRRIS